MTADVFARDGKVVIDIANTEVALEPREARRLAELIRQTSYQTPHSYRKPKPEPKPVEVAVLDDAVLGVVRGAEFGSPTMTEIGAQLRDAVGRLLTKKKIELSHGRLRAA